MSHASMLRPLIKRERIRMAKINFSIIFFASHKPSNHPCLSHYVKTVINERRQKSSVLGAARQEHAFAQPLYTTGLCIHCLPDSPFTPAKSMKKHAWAHLYTCKRAHTRVNVCGTAWYSVSCVCGGVYGGSYRKTGWFTLLPRDNGHANRK